MGPIWGRQDPGGPHVGPMNFAIWGYSCATEMRKSFCFSDIDQGLSFLKRCSRAVSFVRQSFEPQTLISDTLERWVIMLNNHYMKMAGKWAIPDCYHKLLGDWLWAFCYCQSEYHSIGFCFNSSRPGQNGRHIPDHIFICIFMNEKNAFWFKIYWSLFVSVQSTITHHWFNRRQAIIWTNVDPIHWRI